MQVVRNSRLGPTEMAKVRDIVDTLIANDNPCLAAGELAAQATQSKSEGPAFERYAASVLHEAGAHELSKRPCSRSLRFEPLGDGRLARFTNAHSFPKADRALIANVEEAINRLVSIGYAIEDAALSYSATPKTSVFINLMGVEVAPQRPERRSTQIVLPPIALTAQPDIAFFNEVDWRILDNVAGCGRAIFQSSLRPNMRQSVLGAFAPGGSDWDVRTRMALALDRLELVLRFSCRFDCDTEHRSATVAFTAPPPSSLPAWTVGDDRSRLLPLGDNASAARMVYSMRLACLLACCCFGSGRTIEHAFVNAESGEGDRLFSFAFERDAFARKTLAAIDSGQVADGSLRFDVEGITDVIAASWLSLVGKQAADRPCAGENTSRTMEPWCDERALPADFVELFGAQRVCDMDAIHYFGGHSDLIEQAKRDADDSVIAAVANLESVVSTLEPDAQPPDDDAEMRALYCGNPFARIALPLLEDELSIGKRAEEFLMGVRPDSGEPGGNQLDSGRPDDERSDSGRPNCEQPSSGRPDGPEAICQRPAGRTADRPQLYFRTPNALFHAHMGLSDLYQRMGDFNGAIAHADRCIALAPTTASAYFRKADILGQQTLYAQAANVLLAGLRCAISKRDCAFLYYHLALLMWHMGRRSDAAAIQVYASSLEGEYAEKARLVVKSLRKRKDSAVIVHASPLAAIRDMNRARIPIAPSDEARGLIAHAAIGLACANAPNAAIPYAAALANFLHADRIIVSACNSLIHGLEENAHPGPRNPGSELA